MNRSLSQLRVLEYADTVAASYAAKVLADLGATVIKVEPAGGDPARHHGPFPPGHDGDPERSGLFLGLNTNKRSVVADADTAQGRVRLADLAAQADIVVHSLSVEESDRVGLGEALLRTHPALVVCALTPYGQTGPHAHWRGEEITIVHGGGWGYLIPGDDPDPTAAPLTVYGYPASCQAGLAAATVALAAARKATQTGIGDHIDFAAMAHVANMLESSFVAWSYRGELAGRSGGRILNPWGIFECADGLVFLVTVEQDQWERLVDMMGTPDWALLPVFEDFDARAANRDVLNVYLREWTSRHTVEYLFHEGQRNRICFAPVFTMADLHAQEHLRERSFFRTVDHPVAGELSYLGPAAHATPSSWRLDRAAPVLGELGADDFDAVDSHREVDRNSAAAQGPDTLGEVARRPLEGVRVIDFSWVWAGPFCTMHLAHLGADVIKVESSTRPGLGRRLPIHPPELEPTLNTCGYFNQWDQSKRSVELDLSDPRSIRQVLALVASADVVVDNYATGVMDRLGLSDDVLRAANQQIILASITGFGHTGPLSTYMGYGPTTAPLSGLTSMTGHAGGRAEEAGVAFGDPAAGLAAAYSIVAAIVGRDRGLEPERIDVSLWEATATNAVDQWMGHALGAPAPARMGNRRPYASPHGVFQCAGQDEWVSIACTNDEQWQALATLIGIDPTQARFATLEDRKQNENELEAVVGDYCRTVEPWRFAEQLQQVGVAAYPSLDCAQLEANPQLAAREFWARFDHPEAGTRTHSGMAWRTRNADNGVRFRAPLLGEHTAEILTDL